MRALKYLIFDADPNAASAYWAAPFKEAGWRNN